jgi:hypothetical protein
LIGHRTNRGTLYSRIRLIESTQTPWLAFLDPDDELSGTGLLAALVVAKRTGADIFQFGCRIVIRRQTMSSLCWREPAGIGVLDVEHENLQKSCGSNPGTHSKDWDFAK